MNVIHAHSNDSHRTTAKDLFDIGYYTIATDRGSSSICRDITDQSRWILFGHIFPGPSFDMLAYSNNSALDQHFTSYDSSAIPLHVHKIGQFMSTALWRTGQCVQRNDHHAAVCSSVTQQPVDSVPPAWGSVHSPYRPLHHKSSISVF